MGILNKIIQSLFGNSKGNKISNNTNVEIDKVKNYINTEPYDKYMIYKNSTEFPDDFVVFDFETTGLDAKTEKIIQIGALRYKNNEKVDEFVTYVNPQKAIPSNITNLTGIKNSDVKNAPTISQIFPRFINFIGEDVLIAHNADFDMKFLLNNAFNLRIKKPQNEVIDTLSLSRKYIKGANGAKLENYKLPTLKAILNINVGSHNSADDCFVCAEVYKKCKEKINSSFKPKKNENIVVDDKFFQIEQHCFKIVKEILLKNNKSLEFFKSTHVGNYYDIVTFYTLVRIKLKGKKQYILSRYNEDEIKRVWKDAVCEPATKSETGTTRIIFNDPDDLFKIESFIIKDFDHNMESIEIYRTNVGCGERNVQEYLNSL